MKNIIIFIFLYLGFICNAQIIIDGNIVLYPTNEPANFASVMIMENNTFIIGCSADDKGKFHIEIPKNIDTFSIVFTYFGFEKTAIPIVGYNIRNLSGEFILGKKYKKEDLLFTEADAERDIKNGILQLYTVGIPILDHVKSKTESTKVEKYKVKYVPLRCSVDQKILQSIELYNNTVKQYLNEKYGESGWE